MKNRIAILVLGVGFATVVAAGTQSSQLPLPSPVEKGTGSTRLPRH